MLPQARERRCQVGRIGHGRRDHDLAIAVARKRRCNLEQRPGCRELERRDDDGVRCRRFGRLCERRDGPVERVVMAEDGLLERS
jgi:hypothetical protein